jgi:hypothetical protein
MSINSTNKIKETIIISISINLPLDLQYNNNINKLFILKI